MQKNLLIAIVWIMNTACLYSQMPLELTDIEFLKGRVKKIETTYYPSKGKHSKVVSEYDTLGRMISKINYYIEEDPHKEYFSYDSIGNVVLHIYEDNDKLQQHAYKYEYDDIGRISRQLELWNGEYFRSYDSIVYNNDNLPIQYLVKHPYSSDQFFISYLDRNNNEKIRNIEEKTDLGINRGKTVSIVEELRVYNDHGFLIKRVRKSEWQEVQKKQSSQNQSILNQMNETINNMGRIVSWKHIEEYDYVDYKYDKHGSWTECKIYLNWEERGRKLDMKIKRKIKYW
jgi:hypothetical protein